jgi:hypothetical protein
MRLSIFSLISVVSLKPLRRSLQRRFGLEGLSQGFEQRSRKNNIPDTLTTRVFFDPVSGLSSAQHLFHEHGSNTSQSGLCKGTAEDASSAARPPISSEST